ncbi:hypothetical protein [Acinetobacter sp. ANC 3813]|uniref:hypothetical protein n=1 Tax=Acinetobacter sp. ANC 3813 TaxID=1977873 RepID=UPI000A33FC4F|nr:hypothetical protein [Acinetobacter sp. ANC 3813]OTG89169.1 hypothetical protein B9T34_13290 [Acinetobacter sp. ANC 3813]
MALVIGWSSVAFAVQKPIHTLMMNPSIVLQIEKEYSPQNAVSQKPEHQMALHQAAGLDSSEYSATAQKHAAHAQQTEQSVPQAQAAMPHQMLADCNDSKTQTKPHCLSDLAQSKGSASCADCALWHCQMTSQSLQAQTLQLAMPALDQLSEQPNTILQVQHLSGYWQALFRPPKA